MKTEGPITVVIRHKVRPGREGEFEDWQRNISQASLKFPGHLGYNVMRPARPMGEYLVLFKFDSLANLERWESSPERRQWLDKLDPLTVAELTRERHTGMEVWFTPHASNAQPPRYKLMLVTFVALYPLITLVQGTIGPLIHDWPLVLRTLATTPLLIVIMTYAAMPWVTQGMSPWLYPEQGRRRPIK